MPRSGKQVKELEQQVVETGNAGDIELFRSGLKLSRIPDEWRLSKSQGRDDFRLKAYKITKWLMKGENI